MSITQLALLGGEPIRSTPYPAWPMHGEAEEALILEVLRSGKWWRYAGDKVHRFEQLFATYHDATYGVAVSSGTTALEAAIWALGLAPGDEVLVPSYTFVASATAIVANGLTPRFVDVDPKTLNIDLAHAEECITPNTRAIMVVHFGGLPCDMDAVMAFAKRHNLIVVEDAAHAHGAKWDGKGLGSFGDVSAFSFQASKNMTCGEGGLVATCDEELFDRVFSHHTHGRHTNKPWYSHHTFSTNVRMTEFQAALLLAQMERLEEQNRIRATNAKLLDAALESIPDLTVVKWDDPRAAQRSYHLYSVRYTPSSPEVPVERLVQALQAEGIPCSAGYPMPVYAQPLFERLAPPPGQPPYHELNLPNVSRVCGEVVWIRQHALLGSEEDTRDIVRALEKVLHNIDALRDEEWAGSPIASPK